MSKVFEEQAIRFLRGEDNPFDAFVVPDKPAHEFSDCHVAEVHGDRIRTDLPRDREISAARIIGRGGSCTRRGC